MPPLMQLPAYDVSRNALLNFAPVNDGLDSIRAAQVSNKKLQQADDQHALERDKFGLSQARHGADMQDRDILRMGKEAEAIHGMQGPARQAAWSAWTQRNPKVAAHMAKFGLDPDDHAAGPQFIATEAAGYDPLKKQLAQAQINNLNRREDPDIVRTLRAAGIDPRSARGQELIGNSIKGNDPIGQAVADAMKGAGAPQQQTPQSPIRPQGLVPQSFDGNAPGGPQLQPMADGAGGGHADLLIPAQTAQPQQQSPQAPMFDSPLGPMPESKARILGFGLAYQGKGEAGKMMMPPDGKLGKEGINHIDKAMIDKAMDLSELQQMRQQFDPKFLGLEGQAKAIGSSWADWLSSGKIDPQQKQFLMDYSRFATVTTERLNNRIKTLSGSAVSGAEEKRMYAANPSMSDGPTTYAGKLDQQIEMQRAAIARYNWLRTQFKGTPEQISELAKSSKIEAFPLDGMKKIYDDRSGAITKELKTRYPQATPDQLNGARRHVLKQEFGI